MTAVSQKLPNLIGGVSEQPDSLKLPGQLRSCTNFYPDPTFGLTKRPGLQGILGLTNTFSAGTWFSILRDSEEKYTCQISRTGGLRIWDADSGVEQTVNTIAAGDLPYLVHKSEDDIDVLQINDLTFVLNRRITVAQSATTTAAITPYGFATVGAVGYNTAYTVILDGTSFTYDTTDNPATRLSVATVVNGIVAVINANASWVATASGRYVHIRRADNADFSLTASGGTSGGALEAFKGTVNSIAQLPTSFLDGSIVKVLAAPASGGDDYWLKFETENGGTNGAGIWAETIGPGVSIGFNPSTMPHAIIREANGTFTFRQLSETAANAATVSTSVSGVVATVAVTTNSKGRYAVGETFPVYGGTGINLRLRVTSVNNDGRVLTVEPSRGGRGYTATNVVTSLSGDTFTISTVQSVTQTIDGMGTQFWKERGTGDDDTNPMPTFVGRTITGIAFFKNRLVLLSGENVICSEAGSYFNFFAITVITFIDSDPIDLSCGSLKPIELRHTIQTSRGLVLFADNAQYMLETTTDAFSASTAEINLLSSYSQSANIAPVDLGSTFVFVEQAATSTGVYEMLVGGGEGTKPLVAELSRTVPSYIPSDIKMLKASASVSTMAMLSRRDLDSLYLFRFYNAGNERQFAAWFKWDLPGTVEFFEFDHDTLYVVLQINGSTSQRVLCKMNLLTESPGGAIIYEGVYLDVRLDLYDYNPTLVYDAVADVTRVCFKDGFQSFSTGINAEVILIDDNEPGVRFEGPIETDLTQPVGEQYYVEVDGDITSLRVALGYNYNASATMPAFYVERDGSKDTLNIPMVNRIMLDSYNSGPFDVTINSEGRNPFTSVLPQIFANQTLANAIPVIRNAQNRVPILAKGDKVDVVINCPYPFPVALTAVTWEGTYNNKGLRSL